MDAVEVRPARAGTLPLAAADIPDGATLVIEGSGSPDGCGTLVVDGDLDLSRIGVRFGPRSSFKGTTFTALRATGTITGELDASTLPGANWHYEYSSDEVVVVHEMKGTTILLL